MIRVYNEILTETKRRIYVKDYGILSFTKNIRKKSE